MDDHNSRTHLCTNCSRQSIQPTAFSLQLLFCMGLICHVLVSWALQQNFPQVWAI